MPQAKSKITRLNGVQQNTHQYDEGDRQLYIHLDGELVLYERMAHHYEWHKVEALLALARVELKEYLCPSSSQAKGNCHHE